MNRNMLKSGAALVLGAVISAAGVKLFLVPNAIAPAGFTGIAAIFEALFSLPIGAMILALNVPLLFIAAKDYGRDFIIKTLIATAIYSFASDMIDFGALTGDLLLASVYGGIIFGFGIGLVLRGGGTTGGTELLAKLVLKKFKRLSMGTMIFIIDAVIIAASCFVFGVESSLYAVAALFITSKLIDIVTNGAANMRAYLIISDEYERIERDIFSAIQRGVTRFYAKGGYSGREKSVLLCVVGSAIEAVALKSVINAADKNAFVIALPASEVLGYGFDENGGIKDAAEKRNGLHNGKKER